MLRRHNLRANRSMAVLDRSPSDIYEDVTGGKQPEKTAKEVRSAKKAHQAAPVPGADVTAEVHAEESGGAIPQQAEVEVSPSYPSDTPVLPSPREYSQNSGLPMEQATPPDYAHLDLLSAHHAHEKKNKKKNQTKNAKKNHIINNQRMDLSIQPFQSPHTIPGGINFLTPEVLSQEDLDRIPIRHRKNKFYQGAVANAKRVREEQERIRQECISPRALFPHESESQAYLSSAFGNSPYVLTDLSPFQRGSTQTLIQQRAPTQQKRVSFLIDSVVEQRAPHQQGHMPSLTQHPSSNQQGHMPSLTQHPSSNQQGHMPSLTQHPSSNQQGHMPSLTQHPSSNEQGHMPSLTQHPSSNEQGHMPSLTQHPSSNQQGHMPSLTQHPSSNQQGHMPSLTQHPSSNEQGHMPSLTQHPSSNQRNNFLTSTLSTVPTGGDGSDSDSDSEVPRNNADILQDRSVGPCAPPLSRDYFVRANFIILKTVGAEVLQGPIRDSNLVFVAHTCFHYLMTFPPSKVTLSVLTAGLAEVDGALKVRPISRDPKKKDLQLLTAAEILEQRSENDNRSGPSSKSAPEKTKSGGKWTNFIDRCRIEVNWAELEDYKVQKKGMTKFINALADAEGHGSCKMWKANARKLFQREIDEWHKNNGKKPYHALTAHEQVVGNRRKPGPKFKIEDAIEGPIMMWHIMVNVCLRRSAEQISMQMEESILPVDLSASSVRRWFARQTILGSIINALVPRGIPLPKRANGSPALTSNIPNLVSIDDRPWYIDAKIYPGHWEGDLIIGADNSGAILALAERYTRWLIAILLTGKDSIIVMMRISEQAKIYAIFSVTFDRGGEFTFHDILKEAGIDTYFCEPGCPNQKGLVENRNGKLRYSLCPDFDFRNLTQEMVNHLCASVNSEIIKEQNCSPFACLKQGLLGAKAMIEAQRLHKEAGLTNIRG